MQGVPWVCYRCAGGRFRRVWDGIFWVWKECLEGESRELVDLIVRPFWRERQLFALRSLCHSDEKVQVRALVVWLLPLWWELVLVVQVLFVWGEGAFVVWVQGGGH